MKAKLFSVIGVLLVAVLAWADAPIAFGTLFVNGAQSTVPTALSATALYVHTATLIAKVDARTTNSQAIFIGTTSADDTQPIQLNPGDTLVIVAHDKQLINLQNWYFDVQTPGDGLAVIYQ